MVEQPNPVIFYHPDAYRVDRKDLKGRHSAGDSFLTAFLDHADGPDVYALCVGKDSGSEFKQRVRASRRPLKAQTLSRANVESLRRQALVYLPHPEIANEAKIRSFLGDTSYALTGVAHTIASLEMLGSIADLSVAPVQPWDALICTSRAVHEAVTKLIDGVEYGLRARLGATRFVRPLLPVIPLGIHSERFRRNDTDRQQWRQRLGIADDAFVILFFGRLSVHAKAAPFQLAQAAELASADVERPLVVVWCGWFNDEFQSRVFTSTAKAMAPSVPFYFVDGRDEQTRFSVWSAADAFCSLSDNIQESFGLTVIEAMAAGLPVVASNWNGYREAVEHGVNGFLIDSYLSPGSLAAAGYRYIGREDTYDRYIGALSQLAFVNLAQTAQALTKLANDESLCAGLADAARKTIAERFDWKVVMPHYVALWSEQTARLDRQRQQSAVTSMPRQSLDAAYTFSGFPSRQLRGSSVLGQGVQFSRWSELIKQPGIVVNPAVLTGRRQIGTLHELFGDGRPRDMDEIVKNFSENEVAAIVRTLHWLIKIGLLELVSA